MQDSFHGASLDAISIGGEEQDFGDAPEGFPVLLLDNGASHVIESGFHLGFLVDDEPDGQPSANADADVPDEDGIVFLDPLTPGTSARIEVTASQAGRLDAWIDFGQDGSWNQLTVQIRCAQSNDVEAEIAFGNGRRCKRVGSARPISKQKRWKLLEIVERAK